MYGKRTRSGQSATSWGAGVSSALVNLYGAGRRQFGELADGNQGGNSETWQPVGTFPDWQTAINGSGSAGNGIRQGKLYSWGINFDGRTGLNTSSGATVFPTQVGTDSDWFECGSNFGSAGGLKGTGQLWTWGSGSNARSARGTFTFSLNPARVGTFADATALDYSGGATGAIIRDGGKLFTWGSNASFATGQNTVSGNTTSPTEVPGSFTDWAIVSMGSLFGLAIRDVDPYTGGGKLYSWGTNTNGRTGQNNGVGNTQIPTQLGSDTDWVDVSAAYNGSFGLGLKTDGSLYSWGFNTSGQLGLNSTTQANAPTEVTTAPSNITVISAGGSYGMLISDGRLFAAGRNTQGQMGIPQGGDNLLVFTQVSDQTDWVDIRCTDNNSMARKRQKVT